MPSVALITGATGGIGRAIVERFVDDGWTVAAVDREAFDRPHPNVVPIEADVTDVAQLAAAARRASELGTLRVGIANAGVLTEDLGSFLDTGHPDAWDSTLRVNVIGVLATFQAVARELVRTAVPGRLLATASIAGLRPEPGLPTYCASKAAVLAIVQALALELGEHGINVNAVAPGPTSTEAQEKVNEERRQAGAQHAAETPSARSERHRNEGRPIRRLARPDEVAAAFAWLASAEASYVTGQTIVVDGGAVLV